MNNTFAHPPYFKEDKEQILSLETFLSYLAIVDKAWSGVTKRTCKTFMFGENCDLIKN